MAYMKTGGKGWQLLKPNGRRVFKGRLVAQFNMRGSRYALFRISKPTIGRAPAALNSR